MIPIFDLDDTLYPERTFVESGFRAVAEFLESAKDWDSDTSIRLMLDVLRTQGRGAVFDELLRSRNAFSSRLVQRCLQIYRQHSPQISLYPEARRLLDANRGRRMYLVTDGNKSVQANKVRALDIEACFAKVFLTHRYGVRHAKPSTYCFELIRKREQCEWSNMVYIGDNPAKDFINLNPLGVLTIRVSTGEHARAVAPPGGDARMRIENLGDLPLITSLMK